MCRWLYEAGNRSETWLSLREMWCTQASRRHGVCDGGNLRMQARNVGAEQHLPPRRVSNALRWLPSFAWQRLTRRVATGRVHLILALADHFEPGYVPGRGTARAPYDEQERRLERWCREYPQALGQWRDNEGRPWVHTYFFPAEQYDRAHLERLAEHCHAGWGEIEIHLHHGTP